MYNIGKEPKKPKHDKNIETDDAEKVSGDIGKIS